MKASSQYYCNKACEYYPCHAIPKDQPFNCLFCFCPLYPLKDCGGEYQIVQGKKDCSACLFPHKPENYSKILQRLKEL